MFNLINGFTKYGNQFRFIDFRLINIFILQEKKVNQVLV